MTLKVAGIQKSSRPFFTSSALKTWYLFPLQNVLLGKINWVLFLPLCVSVKYKSCWRKEIFLTFSKQNILLSINHMNQILLPCIQKIMHFYRTWKDIFSPLLLQHFAFNFVKHFPFLCCATTACLVGASCKAAADKSSP